MVLQCTAVARAQECGRWRAACSWRRSRKAFTPGAWLLWPLLPQYRRVRWVASWDGVTLTTANPRNGSLLDGQIEDQEYVRGGRTVLRKPVVEDRCGGAVGLGPLAWDCRPESHGATNGAANSWRSIAPQYRREDVFYRRKVSSTDDDFGDVRQIYRTDQCRRHLVSGFLGQLPEHRRLLRRGRSGLDASELGVQNRPIAREFMENCALVATFVGRLEAAGLQRKWPLFTPSG